MKAGRELDALIAEKVFGFNPFMYGFKAGFKDCDGNEVIRKFTDKKRAEKHSRPYRPQLEGMKREKNKKILTIIKCKKYSTDIAAAWEVVEKIDKQFTITKCKEGFSVEVDEYFCHAISETVAGTAPHAICLAALKAVGYNEYRPKDRPEREE